MKGLNTLIKLAKRTLDELRRKMVAFESQKAQLQQLSARLQQELEHEIEMASKQPEMGSFFGGFSKRIQKRQEEIAAEVKKIDNEINALRDKITEAFGEQKKYEIALENSKARAKEAQNRKDTLMLDEIASQQHQRKEKESS